MLYTEIDYQQAFRYTKEFVGGVKTPDGSEVKVFHLTKRPKLLLEYHGKIYLLSVLDDIMELIDTLEELEDENLENKSKQDEGEQNEHHLNDDVKE